MLCLWSDPPGFNCCVSFTQVFSCIYCWVISCLYLDLYLSGDDTSIKYGSFTRTKHLFVWFTSEIRVRLAPSSKNIVLTLPMRSFFCGLFLLFVFNVCHAVLSVPCILWSSAGKWLTSWLFCMWRFQVKLSFFHIVSWVICGIWLFRFLIFSFSLALLMYGPDFFYIVLSIEFGNYPSRRTREMVT